MARTDDRSTVLDLAGDARWAPLRYLALFGLDVAAVEQADRVARTLDGPGGHLVAAAGTDVVGQVSARPIEDLTDHFDTQFFEAGPLLTDDRPDVDRAVVGRMLLRALRQSLAEGEPAAIALRLEADDLDGLLAAESAGFRVRETTATFINDLQRRDKNPPWEIGDSVRLHRFGIDPELPASTFDGLRGQAGQVVLDHYHADPWLPNDRCDALYERVLDRALHGIGADALVLRFLGEKLIGLGTWRHWRELEPYGVSMAGSAFGFRVEGAPVGNQYEVAAYVCNQSLTGNRLLEWSTQANNFPMINMMSRQPSIRLCRTSHVLHCWTDDAWV